MKVILLEDVKSLGKRDDVVKVSDGYARNLLLPRNLGIEATQKNLNELKQRKRHEEKAAQESLDAAKAFAEEISSKEVTVSLKTGEGGRVFGSVSAKEIATAAKEQLSIELDKKKIQLPEGGLKALGVHEVPVKVHPKVTATLKVRAVEE